MLSNILFSLSLSVIIFIIAIIMYTIIMVYNIIIILMMVQDSKIPFFCSKFPWARERISLKNINNLCMLSQKGLPALDYII
jgi:hypothetical protein